MPGMKVEYADPATATNMVQGARYDPTTGQMKTVSEFLTSPQPIIPIMSAFQPYPEFMVAGSPYPETPAAKTRMYDRALAPVMELRTLFSKTFGSISR